MKSHLIFIACLVGALATVVVHAAPRVNVLLLVSDDQRADTIQALGNSTIETPQLDSLVRRGMTFRHAISPNPLCRPARAELMTGMTSFHNGVLGSGTLKRGLVTLPERLRRAGYHTWHVGKWDSGGRPTDAGYEATHGLFTGGGAGQPNTYPVDDGGAAVTGYRGYVFQDDDGTKHPERGIGLTPDISGKFADAAIEFLRRDADRPFFLQVNFTAPHDPLLVPPELKNRYQSTEMRLPKNFLPQHPFDHGNLRGRDELLWPWPRTPELVRAELARYYSVITDLDTQIGRVLAVLDQSGRRDQTLVIFTSDQGLAIGSHGLRGKQSMYEHTITTPLIVAGPGVLAEKRRDALVYLRDLYPTICELAGVAVPDGLDGRSLAAVLNGSATKVRDEVFCYFGEVERAVRTERWKLVHYPQLDRWQLFDLQADPDEINDLIDRPGHAGTVAKLKARLAALRAEAGDVASKKD
ncbi:MAG: sulfatase-like hydrolase/transferase [Planctomycetes bacterium]|nr:sulfatase-like hydrolase/transferase [Planctomycetota bacterium]